MYCRFLQKKVTHSFPGKDFAKLRKERNKKDAENKSIQKIHGCGTLCWNVGWTGREYAGNSAGCHKNSKYQCDMRENKDDCGSDYDVNVTYTHSDYKDKSTLFESRKYTEKALAPGESYTFFVYSCMPYSKNSVSVAKSKYQSVSENDVYTAVDSFNQQQTLFNYANNTNEKITVKISYANLDENGKINSCGETEEIVLPANSRPSYAILNYGFCPSNVKIVDSHAYVTK